MPDRVLPVEQYGTGRDPFQGQGFHAPTDGITDGASSAPATGHLPRRSGVGGFVSPDLVEALANAMIGLAISWAATFFVLGYTATGSFAVTAMFFAISFTRSRVLRAVFRRFAG